MKIIRCLMIVFNQLLGIILGLKAWEELLLLLRQGKGMMR